MPTLTPKGGIPAIPVRNDERMLEIKGQKVSILSMASGSTGGGGGYDA